jgi:diacylglycerol kinase (ATP)
MDRTRLNRRSRVFRVRVGRSFVFAWAGLAHLFRTQRNARIELAAGVAALLVAAWVGISAVEWAVLVVTITGVLVLEALNTAIEAIADLVSPQLHPKAKIAKDVAAAMVLLAAAAAVVVGLLILGPPLWRRMIG